MTTAMNTAMDTAKAALDSATGVAKTAASSTRSTALDVAKGVMTFVSLLRDVDTDDVLGFVGLARKRSALPTIALLGGGIVIGAGIGMLLAPVSGRQVRAFLLGKLGVVRGQLAEQADMVQDKAGQLVGQVQGKAGEFIDQVQDKAEQVVGQVQEKVEGMTEGTTGSASAEETDEGRKNRRARSNHNTHIS